MRSWCKLAEVDARVVESRAATGRRGTVAVQSGSSLKMISLALRGGHALPWLVQWHLALRLGRGAIALEEIGVALRLPGGGLLVASIGVHYNNARVLINLNVACHIRR